MVLERMEHIAVFEEKLPLTPNDLKKEITSIDLLLEGKLRSKLEGRCSRHGFVLSDTIKILSRSMGAVERGRFTGSLIYHVQAEGSVLNPPDGTILEGEVIRKNKMGLYVNYKDAIRIIVPRDADIGNEELDSIEVGEVIKVEIKKSRFQVNDAYILSVGLFKGRGKGLPATVKRTMNKPLEEAEEEAGEEEAGEEEDAEEEAVEEEEAKEEE